MIVRMFIKIVERWRGNREEEKGLINQLKGWRKRLILKKINCI